MSLKLPKQDRMLLQQNKQLGWIIPARLANPRIPQRGCLRREDGPDANAATEEIDVAAAAASMLRQRLATAGNPLKCRPSR